MIYVRRMTIVESMTEIAIDADKFLINGKPTYAQGSYRGKSIEGMLFNSRMIQAIFDDQCAETRTLWAYPDTGEWDAERNTDDFCAQLPEYRKHGLLAVSVGLQGGGSIYTPAIYDNYLNSAFTPAAELKQPYFDRLAKVLKAADKAGMVVIVNYFYIKQAKKMPADIFFPLTEKITAWLLKSGHRNILVDVANEAGDWWEMKPYRDENIHKLIAAAKGVSLGGRRLLVSSSTCGGEALPHGKWRETEDLHMPHGNGCSAEQLKTKLAKFKCDNEFKRTPKPVLVNEDTLFIDNLEAAVQTGCSWGYYDQGKGCDYTWDGDRMNWRGTKREKKLADLSGFQTLPVNWGINTPEKRAFFNKVKEITDGEDYSLPPQRHSE